MTSPIIRKSLQAAIIVALGLTLGACSGFNKNTTDNTSPSDSTSEADTDSISVETPSENTTEPLVIKSTQNEDLNVKDQAVETGKIEDCDKIEDTQIKNKCKDDIYYSQALATKDKSNCENISSSERQEDCLAKIK